MFSRQNHAARARTLLRFDAVALLFANCVRCPKICFFIVTIEMD